MGISLGWVVFFAASATAAPPAGQDAAPISYSVRMAEAHGVSWREAVFTRLKPVARQGSATVWTMPRSTAKNLVRELSKNTTGKILEAPRVTALAGVPATIQVRQNRTFVTQASWNGDESTSSTTPENVRIGWHTTLIGRKLDQGILVKIVFEDTEIRGVHKVNLCLPHEPQPSKREVSLSKKLLGDSATARANPLAFENSPFADTGSAADDANKAKLNKLMDEATTAYAEGKYVECEAFAKRAMEVDPNELAASMLLFKAKTERRFKHDQRIRGESADRDAEPGCCAEETTCPATNASSSVCETFAEVDAQQAGKDALEIPEIANQEILGEWLIPNGECLLVSFGPHTVADKDGKAIVRECLAFVEADSQSGIAPPAAPPGAFVMPVPIAPRAYGPPQPTPPAPLDQTLPSGRYMHDDVKYLEVSPDFPWANTQAATQRAKERSLNSETPARIARVPAPVGPDAKLPMPPAPTRSFPQGVHVDGSNAKLPPLPDEEMEEESAESESAEPLPSPQTKKPKQSKPEPASDSGTTKASFTQPKSSTVFLPSVFLPGASVGFQFLLPVKPLSLKLPFNQRLEIEIFGRVVPDKRPTDSGQ